MTFQSCLTCTSGIPEYYNGRALPLVRCSHLAFLRAGMTDPDHPDVVVTVDPEEGQLSHVQQREAAERGMFLTDFLDGAPNRYCDHWTPALVKAHEILEHFGDDIGNYSWLPDHLREWWGDGNPLDEVTLPELHELHGTHGRKSVQVPAKYLPPEYSPCSTCVHFQLSHNGKRLDLGRGTCNALAANTGLFSQDETETRRTTYRFFSCEHHTEDGERVPDSMVPIGQRVYSYIGLNDPNPSLEVYERYHRSPVFERESVLDREVTEFPNEELESELRVRHRSFDYQRLYHDLEMDAVNQYFGRRVRKFTRESHEYWDDYDYGDPDDLFDDHDTEDD